MENCIFCKIIKEEIPSYKIYEDDNIIAFLDINPISNGHTLIVPKNHVLDLETISKDDLDYVNYGAKIVYQILLDKLHPLGLRVIQNNGSLQEVKHYHMHLIPSYKEKELIDVKAVYEILTK